MSRSQLDVISRAFDRARHNPLMLGDLISALKAQLTDSENRIEALERAIAALKQERAPIL